MRRILTLFGIALLLAVPARAAINYTETDSSSTPCTFGDGGTLSDDRLIVDGGTAGSTEIVMNLTSTDFRFIIYFWVSPGSINWNSGSFTTRLDVTTADMNSNWTAVRIRRYNSSCVLQEILADDTGLGIGLGSTGVVSHTSTISAASSPSSTDVLLVSVDIENTAHSSTTGITPDQDIDTPFTTAGGAAPNRRHRSINFGMFLPFGILGVGGWFRRPFWAGNLPQSVV